MEQVANAFYENYNSETDTAIREAISVILELEGEFYGLPWNLSKELYLSESDKNVFFIEIVQETVK